MWRPDEVVHQDKRKATALWVLLILSILTYGSYLVYQADVKRSNPSTSFTLSNEVYSYPDVWMCLYDYYGCDDWSLEEGCAASMNRTMGGTSKATYHPGGENEQDINVEYALAQGWCVIYETSAVTINVGEERDAADYLDYILLDMYWYPGGENDSTTCIHQEGEWQNHSESVFVFLHDPETDILSTGIQVPYSCITNESSSHAFTYVGMGLTRIEQLEGGTTTSYKALATTTSTYKFTRDENVKAIDRPYAYLAMQLEQEPDSLQNIFEIDPLEIPELLGSVGGFWDFLLILWPLFFVATVRTNASLKMRDLRGVVPSAHMIKTSIKSSFGTFDRATTPHEQEGNEAPPPWERSGPMVGEVFIRLFDDHGLVAVVNGDRIKKFLKDELRAIYLKNGADEPGLQKLIPANTHLVLVPPGSTTTSVATVIAGRCRVGGDCATDNFDEAAIPMRVKRAHCTVLQSQLLGSSPYVEPSDEIDEESDVDLEEWKNEQDEACEGKQPIQAPFPKPAHQPYSSKRLVVEGITLPP